MNISSYLERIDYTGPATPTRATLDALIRHHQLAVPFENIDIVRLHRPIELDANRHYAKIVGERRGGFCYELNGLFGALLTDLGYGVAHAYGVWPVNGGDRWTQQFEHIVLMVSLPDSSEQLLVDVGFGADCPVVAIPLLDNVETPVEHRAIAAYRARSLPNRTNIWRIEARRHDAEWALVYEVDATPRSIEEFVFRCDELQFSRDSHFTQRLICSRPLANGRVTLGGGSFILTLDDERSERPISGLDDELSLLRKWFGIEIDPLDYGEQ